MTASSETPEFQAQWKQLVNQARQEGEVVVILGSFRSHDHRPIFEAFTRKFGVKVVATTGSGSTNSRRVLVERSRGRFTADVSMVAGSSSERLREAGALVPLAPLFIHPEVVDRSQGWLVNEYVWRDPQGAFVAAYFVAMDQNIADIYYNTNNVTPEEIDSLQSLRDLLKPQWRGRIVSILDPDFGGVTSDRTQAWRVLGREWFEPFIREIEPQLLQGGSARELSDGIARGKYDVAIFIGLARTDLDKMAETGLPVRKLTRTLAEGPAIDISGSLSVLGRAPHPKAAQLFINWYLSRDGQNTRHELIADESPDPSLRTDVAQGKVTDADWKLVRAIKPGSMGLKGSPEWLFKAEEVSNFVREICRELGCYGY